MNTHRLRLEGQLQLSVGRQIHKDDVARFELALEKLQCWKRRASDGPLRLLRETVSKLMARGFPAHQTAPSRKEHA